MYVRNDSYKYFRIEARELTSQLRSALPELEQAPGDGSLLARLFRLAHTLKGAALVVKQREIAELAHALEDALLPYRGGAAVPPGQPDRLRGLLGAIERHLSATVGPAHSTVFDEQFSCARVEIAELDALLGEVEETQAQLQAVHRVLASIEHAGRLAQSLAQRLSSSAPPAVPHDEVRQDASAMAEELRTLLPRLHEGLGTAVQQVERELRQLHDKAEHVRLLPAHVLFGAVEQAALEAADTLGKRVLLTTRGGDLRLSAEVLSTLQPALLQLARNAVAHGVEPVAERRRHGKPDAGRVEIEVRRHGGHAFAFMCRDDGAGIDLAAVAAAAKRAGHRDEEIDGLACDELLRLLLRERISTSDRITEAAGRGIGLDVVRDAVERLSAQINMTTRAGVGSSFELLVPVSLAALDALIVEAGGVTAAIPLDAVERTAEVRAGDLTLTAHGQAAWLEHTSLPFARLSDALCGPSTARGAAGPHSLLVIRAGASSCAIGVDRLRGTAKIVVRPLPRLSPAAALIGGIAIDAHGDPQLVLDPEQLVAYARAEPGRPLP